MPYNHPVLGVPVMTTGEFWVSEAKKEGKEASEIMGDFYDEIAQDCANAEESLKNNFSAIFEMLKGHYDVDPECSEFEPVEVLSVEMTKVNYSFSKDSTSFIAMVKCADGLKRLVQYSQTSYHGSYMEPPDFDSDCRVLSIVA
jgi:hypothetical protein